MKVRAQSTEGFMYTVGVSAYVALISWLIYNGETFFGTERSFLGLLLFLMLFIISALVTSGLVFGKPILLYLEGHKKEGLTLLGYTVGWLAGITIVISLIAAITL